MIQCLYCPVVFATKAERRRHMRDEHGDYPCASGCKSSEGDVCGGPRCT